MSNYILTSDGELYHWGIKGQKWGVRRYQNKDGSLTPAGKKRLEKMDAKFNKRHSDKAQIALQKRDKLVGDKKKQIADTKRDIKAMEKMRDTDIDNIDFDKEARKVIKENMSYERESYRMGYSDYGGRKPTEQDAINVFFWQNGMEAPPNASAKDIAKVLRADAEIHKKNRVYDKIIEMDQKYIEQGERIIQAVSSMPLKEIYDNRNDIFYRYWKDRGYYDD